MAGQVVASSTGVFEAGAGAISVTVRMLSDWHVGTGSGGASDVDRAVKRDGVGLPFVPARSLWGVWRDACEQVALGLDGGRPGAWWRWVEWTFGTQPALTDADAHVEPLAAPEPAKFSLTAARFPEPLRPFLTDARIGTSVTTVRSGVGISRETGTAIPNALYRIEVARGGCDLEATLQLPADLPPEAQALLVVGAASIERLGGKRRRGLGRCEVKIEGASVAAAVEVIRAAGPAVEEPLFEAQAGKAGPPLTVTSTVGDDRSGWRSVSVTITALSPVRLPTRTVGNSTSTGVRLPGSVLIAVLQGRVSASLAPLLASGQLRLGEGVPLGDDGSPLSAAPRSLAVSKVGDPIVRDLFGSEIGPVRRLGGGVMVSLQNGQLMRSGIGLSTSIHNSIADDVQRPTVDTGGLFSFETVDEGTRWRSEVVMSSDAAELLADALQGLDGADVRVGASIKDDYGLAKVAVGDLTPLRPDTAAVGASLADASGSVAILLSSDAVLLDEVLRPDPTPARFVAELARSLGLAPDRLQVQEALCSQGRVESWHSRWRLPRPTLATLAAGSVVKVVGFEPDDLEALHAVAMLGVGERTAEGFGRFEVDPLLLSEPVGSLVLDADVAEQVVPAGRVEVPAGDWSRNIAGDALVRWARRRAEEVAASEVEMAAFDPAFGEAFDATRVHRLSRTQLGALRSVLGDGPDWVSVTKAWLDGVEATDNRRDQWPKPLRDWFRGVLERPSPDRERAVLGLDEWTDDVVEAVEARLLPTFLGELVRALQHRSRNDVSLSDRGSVGADHD